MQIYFLFHLYYRCFFFLFQCFMGNNFNIQQFCFPHILIIHRFLAVHICIHNYIVIMNNHCNNINFDLVGKILVFVYLSDCMNIMVVVPCKSPSHQICMAVVPFEKYPYLFDLYRHGKLAIIFFQSFIFFCQ